MAMRIMCTVNCGSDRFLIDRSVTAELDWDGNELQSHDSDDGATHLRCADCGADAEWKDEEENGDVIRVRLNDYAEDGVPAEPKEAVITITQGTNMDAITVDFGDGRVYIEQKNGTPRVLVHNDDGDPVVAMDLMAGSKPDLDPA